MDVEPVPCPYCGSSLTVRAPGQMEWVWLMVSAATLFLRWFLTMARYGQYRGEPGAYLCGTCRRRFTFFV